MAKPDPQKKALHVLEGLFRKERSFGDRGAPYHAVQYRKCDYNDYSPVHQLTSYLNRAGKPKVGLWRRLTRAVQ